MIAGLVLTASPATAGSNTITVEGTADTTTVDDTCTLREAIVNANADAATHPDCAAGAGFDAVILPQGNYSLSSALPDLTDIDGIYFIGAGRTQSVILGGTVQRGLYVDEGPVILETIGISGTKASGSGAALYVESGEIVDVYASGFSSSDSSSNGGAIYNDGGTVTVERSSFSGNLASIDGGAIWTRGTLKISDTELSGNVSRFGHGGAIYVESGTATVERALLINNHTRSGSGGAIYVQNPLGDLTLTNSTLTQNSADHPSECCAARGGAIVNDNKATLNNVTITENTAEGSGGGISGFGYASSSTVISNSIVSGNSTTVPGGDQDCDGTQAFDSIGHNLGPETECKFDDPSDIHGDPKLLPLASNGAELSTLAPAQDSPALDAGSPLDPNTGPGACEEWDQRRVSRPEDGPDANNVARCDIGAFERQTTQHPREISLKLRKHLIAKGSVTVPDGFNACRRRVKVVIQKKTNEGWKKVKGTRTDTAGQFSVALTDRPLRFRGVVPTVEKTVRGDGHVCQKEISEPRRHRHK